MEAGIYGEYTIRTFHGDGTADVRTVRNKLNRKMRKFFLDCLCDSVSTGQWNVNAMAFGTACNPPTDTDEDMDDEFWRTTELTRSPATAAVTDDSITWTMMLCKGQHTSDWPVHTACGEAGVFAASGQMLSHVKIDPPVNRLTNDIIQIDFTFTIVLNGGLSADIVSEGGFGEEGC